MALADYFERSATAIAHVIGGYDSTAIADALDRHTVGVDIGPDAASPEGEALTDLLVRLFARLYPSLSLSGRATDLDKWRQLATAINPKIELDSERPDIAVAVGDANPAAATVIYAGSRGWDAHISSETPRTVGSTTNPLGAGAAACIAAANVFRSIFDEEPRLDSDLKLSTLHMRRGVTRSSLTPAGLNVGDETVIVGLGAIGNALAWALNRFEPAGTVHLVDPQAIELSNLQRYVLADRQDAGTAKVTQIAHRCISLTTVRHESDWAGFVADHGNRWERVIVALDSARDRRAVQATLPRWIANAWTQPGDLGVSEHPWTTDGACLRCLYLPDEALPSEDKLIARALRIERPDRELQLRNLLHANAPPPAELLDEIARNLDVPRDHLEPFGQRPMRDLYVQGICGGAVFPLSRLNDVPRDVHVPLAHQSALAGVLLASRLAAHALGRASTMTMVARIDVTRPIGEFATRPAQKDPRGLCICQDAVYQDAFRLKYKRRRRPPSPGPA